MATTFEVGKEYVHLGHFVKLIEIEDDDTARVKNRFEEYATVRLSELSPKEPRGEAKKRLFVDSPQSDGVIWYVGDDVASAKIGIGHLLEGDIAELFAGDCEGDEIDVTLSIREMTDEEVANLSDA